MPNHTLPHIFLLFTPPQQWHKGVGVSTVPPYLVCKRCGKFSIKPIH